MNLTDTLNSLEITSLKSVTIMTFLSAVAVFLVCLLAITVILKIVDHIQKRSRIDNTVKSFVRSGIKIGLWIVTIIILADRLGIPSTSLVTLVGVAGLALSLAFQGILSNLFSGLTMLTTKPFVAGDTVEVGGVAGTVTEVGLFYTTLITADNKTVFIPNSQVADAKIINFSKQKTRRIELSVSAGYEAPTQSVKQALMEVISEDARVLNAPPPFVGISGYQQGAVEYVLRVWTKQEDFADVSFALNEAVRAKFEQCGLKMPCARLNVQLVSDEKPQ